ncbi:hypothetical protein BDV97DRAFT_80007 [Delphinella strobiligena]|nr:hypothetical protein BDV97DRAFT_80007 [Delphinella strobiligena]
MKFFHVRTRTVGQRWESTAMSLNEICSCFDIACWLPMCCCCSPLLARLLSVMALASYKVRTKTVCCCTLSPLFSCAAIVLLESPCRVRLSSQFLFVNIPGLWSTLKMELCLSDKHAYYDKQRIARHVSLAPLPSKA